MSPPPERGRAIALGLIGVAAAAGVVLATDEGFRRQVLASVKALGEEIVGREETGCGQAEGDPGIRS